MRELSRAEVTRWFSVSQGTERRAAPAGAELGRAGDNFGTAAALFTGWAFRYQMLADGRRQILDVLLPGDVFGLEAAVSDSALHYAVKATTPVTYAVMADGVLKQLIATAPRFGAALLEHHLVERRRADRHATLIGRCSAEERIAGFLIELHARLRKRSLGNPGSFNMPLTQQQIGDHLGLTVVHVNRLLRRLRETGIVTARERVVVIHDLSALRRLAHANGEGGWHAGQDDFGSPAPPM